MVLASLDTVVGLRVPEPLNWALFRGSGFAWEAECFRIEQSPNAPLGMPRRRRALLDQLLTTLSSDSLLGPLGVIL